MDLMKEKTTAIVDFISQHDNYLLTTHINADGDAYGSLLACSLWLDKLGKKYRILLHDQQIDSKYSFIGNWEKIESLNEKDIPKLKGSFNALLIFDAPGDRRIGDIAFLISAKTKCLKIDHHPAENIYSDLDWVDTNASSASAMVFEVIYQSKIEMDVALATALYTGIIFDTGRLSFSNTRKRDFEICSILVGCGANPGLVTNKMFFSNKIKSLNALGIGLKSLKSYCGGKVGIIILKNNELQGIEASDLESLANYTVSAEGVEVGAYIREIEMGFFKISLRSKEYVDVSEIAKHFDGGGHKRASGGSFEGTIYDLLAKMIKLLQDKV